MVQLCLPRLRLVSARNKRVIHVAELTSVELLKGPVTSNELAGVFHHVLLLMHAKVDLRLVEGNSVTRQLQIATVAVALVDAVHEDKHGDARRDVAILREGDCEACRISRNSDERLDTAVGVLGAVLLQLRGGWEELDGADELLELRHGEAIGDAPLS